jgi:hypothetical protein
MKRYAIPSLALALACANTHAGTSETTTITPAAGSASDVVSGTLSLDFNTHFVSYGIDVWGDGSSMSDPTFNPMVELAFALPGDVTFTLGTWWDVNSKIDSAIGGRIQEVDVWTGLSYTFDKLTVGLVYNAWMYGSTTEESLDVSLAYDTFLSPSLTIHNRLDPGASGGNNGTVLVLGLSHGIDVGPLSVSFPVNIGYFIDDDFHANSTDSGFGFATIGVAASLPLTPYIGDSFGDWSLNSGLTYYFTDGDVVANARKDNFLTASLGVALSF